MRIALFIFLWMVSVVPSIAQVVGPLIPSGANPISQNGISNIASYGDSLWIGPRMQLNVGGSFDWIRPEGADSVLNGRGRMFSIALSKDTVVAGIGYNILVDDNSIQSGMGFYTSVNGGKQWRFIPFPLDPCNRTNPTAACDDLVISYGSGNLKALPVIVQQQSPPYDVSFFGNTIFFAGWASGIKRSRDFGQTWERIVLPPTRFSELNPNLAYSFYINPRPPARGEPNPTDYLNFNAFSVFIDSDMNVWAGTAGGINISDNALSADASRIRWRHITSSGAKNGLLGNWIIQIKQDPITKRVWMTNWVGGLQNEKYGIVSTSDLGVSFEQYLEGEKIYDIAFDGPRIYAVGDNGLFYSPDGGKTWEQIKQIASANTYLKEGTIFYSVSKAGNRIWVGTSDGLASTDDHGRSWQITRVNMLPGISNPFQNDVPNVKTYAYPNPFSHRQHNQVRIVFETPTSSTVRIRIYDFGMNLVRELDRVDLQSGYYEAIWDGYDGLGRKVANGSYFYQIESGSYKANGNILILD